MALHSAAAVVRPCTRPCEAKMTPAPMNPMPVTTCEAMRVASSPWLVAVATDR